MHHQKVRRTSLSRSTAFGIFLLTASLPALATENLDPSAVKPMYVPGYLRAGTESQLGLEVTRFINSRKIRDEQRGQVPVSLRFSDSGEVIYIDLGTEMAKFADTLEVEDLQKEIRLLIDKNLDSFVIRYVQYTYGGRTVDDIHPRPGRRGDITHSPRSDGPLVIAGGHGLYFHHNWKDWRFQRDKTNGLVEDLVTRELSDELTSIFESRGSVPVESPRPAREGQHEASGMRWNELGARYFLEERYPESGSAIWQTTGDRERADVERIDDIYSRPFFANHINAQASIHLHTNASSQESASGTLVFFQKNRQRDKALANNILCYMAEKIHSVAGYEKFLVAMEAKESDYAENREANSPSVIVETAFHTNLNDAEALKDPMFRTAAMKGVEKGYRLFTEGKPCQRFNLERIDNKSLGTGETVTIEAEYKGYPDLPLKLEVKVRDCPRGWTCTGGTRVIRELGPSPLRFDVSCRAPESGSVDFETTLTDIDGVTSDRVQHYVNCSVPYDDRDPTVEGVMEMVPEGDFPSPPEPVIKT